jgi:hypothetical protein
LGVGRPIDAAAALASSCSPGESGQYDAGVVRTRYAARVTSNDKQVELMRLAGPRRRAALALRLSDQTIALARRAIARRHPEMSKQELRVEFVRIHYGQELASRLERWLVERRTA